MYEQKILGNSFYLFILFFFLFFVFLFVFLFCFVLFCFVLERERKKSVTLFELNKFSPINLYPGNKM